VPASQRIVQVCLFMVAAIALVGGTVQMVLGQPETTPRLDNVHRFLAGVYFSMGVISFWAARTVRRQGTLVYLIAFAVLLAGCGRLYSMSQVGLPTPHAVWLGYLIPELALPFVLAFAHRASPRADAP
jgi:VanZ family protein